MGFTSLLKDTFVPYTLTVTDDGVGGQVETWTEGTAFQGRLSILSASERLGADKVTVYASHRLYCDASVSLSEDDKVTFDSRTFQVRTIQKPSELGTGIGHLEIDVLELD
ncbi:MAG: head-tail adaptor protein [Dehalococcoidales bacterium]|nr:head-tail adaptor protein [Dehalococcoidales bacterium]